MEVNNIVNILTAIGSENLNKLLKKENEFNVLENDFLYKEAVLEYLDINKNVDIIVLYENLPGEINILELIKKIKLINLEITFFVILENKNKELEKLLNLENIKNIFYIDEIKTEEIILNLKNCKLENSRKLQEEIFLLKKIINKKDEELLNLKKINKKIFLIIENTKIEINKNNLKKIFLEDKINLKKMQLEINNNIFFINKKIAKNIIKKFIID